MSTINNTSKLQPMGVGDILDTTFSLYRKHFLLFLGIASVYFFAILIEYSLKGFISGTIQKALIPSFTAMPFAIVSTSGVVLASATVYLGENITSSAALRQVFKRFFPILGSHLIWRMFLVFTFISISFSIILTIRQGASGILLGLIGFPIACYFLVCWVFHLPIVLLEEPRVGYALKRSSELVRGTWWQVVGILILILLTSYAIAVIFKVSLGFIFIFTKFAGNTDLRSIIEWSIMEKVLDTSNFFFYVIMTSADLILKALVLPIWVIGVTILYFDRRIRKEGSDIELTASIGEDV
ncbi:hypothetical protein C6501_07220 [Candidatus Poribacteria bacterium]|nr:MAG: hypothetical protein C6501_07220 [Candidatus Poribacteria bacterium]